MTPLPDSAYDEIVAVLLDEAERLTKPVMEPQERVEPVESDGAA
jgi:hypothetical protein